MGSSTPTLSPLVAARPLVFIDTIIELAGFEGYHRVKKRRMEEKASQNSTGLTVPTKTQPFS